MTPTNINTVECLTFTHTFFVSFISNETLHVLFESTSSRRGQHVYTS